MFMCVVVLETAVSAIYSATRSSCNTKLKNDSLRINSNAMFFGRASIGMKKPTTSVAVATLFFATDTDFRIW